MSRLEHVAVATRSIDKAAAFYTRFLDLSPETVETFPDEQLRMAILRAGEVRIELMEPTSKSSTISRFLETRGEGLHHISFRSPRFDELITLLREEGVRLVYGEERRSVRGYRYNFIHPESTGGVLIEVTD